MRKKYLFAIVFFLGVTCHVKGQSFRNFEVPLAVQGGYMVNNHGDHEFGYGFGATALFKNHWFNNASNDRNYLVGSFKIASVPEKGGRLFGFVDGEKSKSVNYLCFLAGYRFGLSKENPAWFFEPKIGFSFIGTDRKAFSYNPTAGYSFEKIDLAIFYDGTNAANSESPLSVAGISVGLRL